MAIHIEVGDHDKPTRDDVYGLDPRSLVVDWKKNLARGGIRPTVDDDLISLAKDMMPKRGPGDTAEGTTGQLNPVTGRLLPDRRVEIVGGFRRTAAAIYLIESGLCPDFKLRVSIKRMSDAEAALANLAENLQRKEMTPLELAHAVRALHEDYGLAMSVIAERMKKSESWLNTVLDLTTLPTDIQTSVQNGDTSVNAALVLTKLESKDQREVFDAAKTSGGKKVTAAAVKEAHRKKQEEKGETGTQKRTIKHLRAFLESKTGPAEHSDGKKLANWIMDYLDGSKTEDGFHRFWDRLFPAPDEAATKKVG